MALLLRLRQAFVRSFSIHKYCSFPSIASGSSHLINTIPTPSKHDPPPSTFLKKRFLFWRQPETKIEKKEIDFVKFPKPSPEEMIETCFQTLANVRGSVEDAKGIQEISDKFKKIGLEMIEQLKCACIREKKSVDDSKVIEEMSDKLKKSGLEMIEQLKAILEFALVSPDLDINCKDTKFEGDKCGNEVITPRLQSPLTEYKNQLSAEDMEMIDEMSEKLTKCIEVLEKLKAMHGFTSPSHDFYIDSKKKKSEDYIVKAKRSVGWLRKRLSKEMLENLNESLRFKDYIEMTETAHMSKESLLNKFSPEEISAYSADVALLKGIHGSTWRSHVFNVDEIKDVDFVVCARHDVGIIYHRDGRCKTEHNTTHTTC